MNAFTIRVIVAAVLGLILVHQARHAAPRSYRRRSFALAALGIMLFMVVNALIALGMTLNAVLITLIVLGMLLLAASLVLIFLAWRRGEMREQVERVRQSIAEERARREDQ